MSTNNWVMAVKTIIILCICTVGNAFSEEARLPTKRLDLSESKPYFNSYKFQSGIRTFRDLGVLAEENSIIGKEAVSFGFAAKSEEAKFFIIGALYSESLAYLRSGSIDLALKRLKSIEKEFINLNVPHSLYNYISKLQNIIERKHYSPEIGAEMLSLFQPFLEDYAKSKGDDKLVLFRAGSWLVDMALTAAAGDKELLRQVDKLNYFIKEMERMEAPRGVLNALDQINKISEEKEIGDRDVERVLKLVKKIQTILG